MERSGDKVGSKKRKKGGRTEEEGIEQVLLKVGVCGCGGGCLYRGRECSVMVFGLQVYFGFEKKSKRFFFAKIGVFRMRVALKLSLNARPQHTC